MTYVEEGYMITPRGYRVSYPIHPLSKEYYERYINREMDEGPNIGCEYYPCHNNHQSCTGGNITSATSLDNSGVIKSDGGRIASVSIGGSIVSGIDNSTGG